MMKHDETMDRCKKERHQRAHHSGQKVAETPKLTDWRIFNGREWYIMTHTVYHFDLFCGFWITTAELSSWNQQGMVQKGWSMSHWACQV